MKELYRFKKYLAEGKLNEEKMDLSYTELTDDEKDDVGDMMNNIYSKINPEGDMNKNTGLFKYIDAWFESKGDSLSRGKLNEMVDEDEIASRIRKLGKENGIANADIKKYVDELSGSFEPDAYKNTTDAELLDDLKLYMDLAEGRLFEENQSPKFKADDFVQPIEGVTYYSLDKPRGTISSKYVGQIEDVYINKPENLEMKDGEYLYSVAKLNHKGRNAMSFDFKESDLESISDPTDYIRSLTPYKRRN
jgi:hypothetical protein